MPLGALGALNGAGPLVLPATPSGAAPAPPPLPGQAPSPDPLTEDSIRRAEAQALAASGAESARALAAVGAARTLAAKGQAIAARLLAEQAADGLGEGEDAEPAPAPPLSGGGAPAPGAKEEPEMVYQDSSGDAAASFQYATAMTTGQAAIMVQHHEQGHIIHARSQAMASGREVVQAYTRVHYRMDWRSGRMVAAGGQAVVTTRAKADIPLPFPQYA